MFLRMNRQQILGRPQTLKIRDAVTTQLCATVTATSRKACIANAKAHYAGAAYKWEWGE